MAGLVIPQERAARWRDLSSRRSERSERVSGSSVMRIIDDAARAMVMAHSQTVVRCRVRQYYVYMLASHSRALYVGVTNSIVRRTAQHRSRIHASFTNRYGITRLVWYEAHHDVRLAIAREKVIKRWSRSRKTWLIELSNPDWRDLSIDWFRDDAPGDR